MKSLFDPDKIAQTNPAVEPRKVEQALALRKALEKAGVAKRADYRIAPAFGGHAKERRTAASDPTCANSTRIIRPR